LADIELLRRSLGAYELDPVLDADRTQHAGVVILGNEPRGRWRAIPALANPVRIRQAIERVLLPPSRWPTGAKAVDEVPFEESAASRARVEPPDLASLPVLEWRPPVASGADRPDLLGTLLSRRGPLPEPSAHQLRATACADERELTSDRSMMVNAAWSLSTHTPYMENSDLLG